MPREWKRITSQIWRSDPYVIESSEEMRDRAWTGVFVFCAYLLEFERSEIVGREPIGPRARTLDAAMRQVETHAQRRGRRRGAA